MYKIINLDIDGSITGDTRIEEIALVEMPAIEQDFIYFAQENNFKVPENVASKACKARKFKEENGSSCGTNVGWTRSSQLCNREPISLDTVKRMYSYFSRHQVDLQSSKSYEDGCGLLMWDAWGGTPGKEWSERIVKRYEDMTNELPPYVNYPTGNTKNDMLIEPILFVERKKGENIDDYVSRCTEYLIKNEGYESDQAYAICKSKSQEHSKGQRVSFDYDDTLNTPRGRGLAMEEINSGSEVYIISARGSKEGIYPLADKLGIPHNRIYATGSNRAKVDKIKQLRINKHYDNNADVIKELGRIGKKFSFDYDYTDEEIEVKKLLEFIKETDIEKFEAVLGTLRGATEEEIKKRNHKNPTTYFKYERVLDGSPDRDFCMSIENRYFRRLEIDLLRDLNTEFGHEKQPYSKWLYKGGPQCIHAWKRYIVQGDVLADQGMVEGTPGTPPKQLPNNGYYSEETKRKSEVAYIISQQEMSREYFGSDSEKRMIFSPLMIPNILIPRIDEATNERYYVKFTPESIEKMAQLYMIEKRLDKTNYEHTNQKMNSVVMVESWLVSGESDKAYQLGFTRDNIPDGTWMGGFKVLNTPEGDIIWNDFIKTGKVKGFSVEGEFLMKFSRIKNDEYLLQEIINIIKEIND